MGAEPADAIVPAVLAHVARPVGGQGRSRREDKLPRPLALAPAIAFEFVAIAIIDDDPRVMRVGDPHAVLLVHHQAGGLAEIPLRRAPGQLILAVRAESL